MKSTAGPVIEPRDSQMEPSRGPGHAPLSLAAIPERRAERPSVSEKLVSLAAPDSFAADQYRALRHTMERLKNLLPNLDWPAGRLYHAMGLAVPLYTPIFVMARVAGWSAHVIEQLDHNRLIRPRARYTGPEVRPVKLADRRG